VGKLSVVVEGTFMRMHDFLLPCNTAGCVCHCQVVKWLTHVRRILVLFKMTMLRAAILHQVLPET
jgi:hypothetical protein